MVTDMVTCFEKLGPGTCIWYQCYIQALPRYDLQMLKVTTPPNKNNIFIKILIRAIASDSIPPLENYIDNNFCPNIDSHRNA